MLGARQILVIARFFYREKQIKLRQLRNRTALLNKGLNCSRNSIVNFPDISRISNGKNCSVGDFSILDIADDPTLPDRQGTVILGDAVYIGEQCNIRASGSEIRIGSQTMIANSVVIVSANHKTTLGTPMFLQSWDTARFGVSIGEDCWIGSNSTILPGTIIGTGSVIAGGSVVRGIIPPFSIWGGVPARHLKDRTT